MASNLQRGEYFRPPHEETSGVPGNPKPYHRSPCPALNTLANHGYIARDGKNLTFSGLARAITEVYNLDWKIGYLLAFVGKIKCVGWNPFASFSLSDLCVHNAIEHDASLFHRDHALLQGADPGFPDDALVEGLANLSADGHYVTTDDIGRYRAQRSQDSITNNPEVTLTADRQRIMGFEAALVGNLLGRDDKISIEHLRSFAAEENLPADYVRRATTLYRADLEPAANKILAEDIPLEQFVKKT